MRTHTHTFRMRRLPLGTFRGMHLQVVALLVPMSWKNRYAISATSCIFVQKLVFQKFKIV